MSTRHVGYAGAEELTGIKRGTLYSLVCLKKIPHLRVGRRHVLFNVEELLQWLESHRVVDLNIPENKPVKSADQGGPS